MIRLTSILTLCCWFLLFRSAQAGDDFSGVKLLRPDSLVGWDYGDPPPAGWKIADGQLTGTRNATPLVSGWTFGDFELHLQWQGTNSPSWKLLLPEVPSGKGLELTWCEGPGCGQVQDGGQTVAPGRPLAARPSAPHVGVVRRTAGTLVLEADGQQSAKVQIRPNRRFGLGLAITGGQVTIADLRLAEPPGRPMLNGNDLAGWWCPGNIKSWAMENGSLVLRGPNGNYLRSEKEYGNFTLSFTYKVQKGGNSGIGIRTPRDGWPSGDGMELQIWDLSRSQPLNEHSEMALYGNMPPLTRVDRSEQWNRVVLKADGWMISAWENGELVQHCNTLHLPELKHRNLQGWIGIQDHNARIEVRDLRVLESPPGTGLAVWQKPPALSGAMAVLDRLLNSERLSAVDGIRSGTVARKVSGDPKREHVLAELAGPGALVRIARSNKEGKLSFYFDGEERPRLEAKAADLWQAVPQVAEDANPVLTLLAYRKSLKVVLSDSKGAEYRRDYVTFPPAVPVESYTRSDPGIPRGWLSAAAYRHGQCWWGVHREYDPLPRFQSPQKTIKPGKTERLLHVNGTGVVLWTKLRANKKVLDNEDLWLEATIDGEKQPAVAAPARYWFPGLAGQEKYPNFVLTDRGGPTNLLAMPYGDGITIAARNRGKKAISGVGVTISVEPANEANRREVAQHMRLRGVFKPGLAPNASNGSPIAPREKTEWLRQDGAGRWVGLVYQQTKGKPTAMASLAIDGRPAAGWSGSAADLFLGQNGDFRKCLSGRHGELCWRYMLLEPVEFAKSLTLEGVGPPGPRLALFYLAK